MTKRTDIRERMALCNNFQAENVIDSLLTDFHFSYFTAK